MQLSNVIVVHLLIFLLAFGEDAAYDSVLGDRRKIHGTFREFVLPLVWKSRETTNAFVVFFFDVESSGITMIRQDREGIARIFAGKTPKYCIMWFHGKMHLRKIPTSLLVV